MPKQNQTPADEKPKKEEAPVGQQTKPGDSEGSQSVAGAAEGQQPAAGDSVTVDSQASQGQAPDSGKPEEETRKPENWLAQNLKVTLRSRHGGLFVNPFNGLRITAEGHTRADGSTDPMTADEIAEDAWTKSQITEGKISVTVCE